MGNNSSFLRQITPVVFSAEGSIRTISQKDVDFLCHTAKLAPEKTARILLHGNPSFDLHEMLIVHVAGQYIRPHINENSAKSFTVIEGEMTVVTFEEDGTIRGIFQLGDHRKRFPFLFWLQDPVFHTVLATTDTVVFIETIKGPHLATSYGKFAPATEDGAAAERYVDWLQKELESANREK